MGVVLVAADLVGRAAGEAADVEGVKADLGLRDRRRGWRAGTRRSCRSRRRGSSAGARRVRRRSPARSRCCGPARTTRSPRWRGRRPRSGSAGRGGVGVDGGAPCQPCGWWFLRRRPPNRTCEFPRIRLSTSASSGWCPLVQLALNVEYPLLSLIETRQPRASVHRRPPRVRTCCAFAATPSPCTGLSPARSTTVAPPPTAAATADGALAPEPKRPASTSAGMFPTFTINRSAGSASSYTPVALPRDNRNTQRGLARPISQHASETIPIS